MKERNKGILLMILASLSFALMASAVKYSGDLPTVQKVFFRNFVGLMVSGTMIYFQPGTFKGKNIPGLISRSIFGLLGVFFYFYAIDHIPLADAVVLNQTSPFFVVIMSAVFLKERIRRFQIPAILMAMLGVSLIIQPEFDASVLPAVVALLSAIFAATAYTTIRHLRLTDRPQIIVFYFTLFSVIVTFPFLLLGYFEKPSAIQVASLLAVGIFATSGQLLMTFAYRFSEAGDLSIYSYGKTVFSVVIGIVIWIEIPNLLSFIGIGAILSGAYINYRFHESRRGLG